MKNKMFVVSLLLCVCFTAATTTSNADEGDTFNGGLQGLEIAPKVFTNVAYGNSRLSVWGHLDNPNRTPDKQLYFVMPVVMLVPESAVCQSNIFTAVTSMQFKVIMWNENVASAVLTQLRQATDNQKLSSPQVTTLPMEQIRLIWTNSAQHLSSNFRLNTDWRSYANPDNVLTFEIVVISVELCPLSVKQLKERPDSLGSLELQYVLHATRASRKQITISGRHLLQAKMYARLQNKVDPTTGSVYLNSDDLNELAREAVSNVVASTTTDADYVDSGDTVSMAKLVYDGLATFKQSTVTMTPRMWESTFWQNEFARPDKLTSYLNKVITKDSGQNHTVRINEKEVGSSSSGSVNFLFKLFGIGASGGNSQFAKTHVTEDDLKAWLLENHKEVQWTGEKFKVKPMDLYRLNTQQISQQQDIVVTNVQVHQVQYTYNVPVSFPGETAGVGGDNAQSTFAITKRLDGLDALLNKEIAQRTTANANIGKEIADITAAVAKEAADRTAADAKEAASRSTADANEIAARKTAAVLADSQKAAAQLRTDIEVRTDAIADMITGVEIYHGQWFKVFDNPLNNWERAAAVCASHGGIPATALSKHLMLKIKHIIPQGISHDNHVVVGLQSTHPTIGWKWVDSGTRKAIDIDRDNTVKPLWLSQEPSVKPYWPEINGAIYNGQTLGYGFNNVNHDNPSNRYVLCQFGTFGTLPVQMEVKVCLPGYFSPFQIRVQVSS